MKNDSASKADKTKQLWSHTHLHLLLHTQRNLVPVALSQGFLPLPPRNDTPRRHPGLAFYQNVATLSGQSLGLQQVLGEVWSDG